MNNVLSINDYLTKKYNNDPNSRFNFNKQKPKLLLIKEYLQNLGMTISKRCGICKSDYILHVRNLSTNEEHYFDTIILHQWIDKLDGMGSIDIQFKLNNKYVFEISLNDVQSIKDTYNNENNYTINLYALKNMNYCIEKYKYDVEVNRELKEM